MTMGWIDKLKDKAQEHTIFVLYALTTLLLLVIWRAVPSSAWDTISEATPKRVLWALAGLLVIIATLEFAYICILRKRITSKKLWRFGILWDQDGGPCCPTCSNYMGSDDKDGFWCAHCDRYWTLTDDNGNLIDRIKARQHIMEL